MFIKNQKITAMKTILLFSLTLLSTIVSAQTYPSQNISLLGHIDPNTYTAGIGGDNRKYAGCWGWKQPVTNNEYALAGGSNGTYFIDISLPSSPSLCAFVNGVSQNCTWRELQTYQNYCYVVSDQCEPNAFQIIDMSALPSTVTVVHNSASLFKFGHTIYIDNARMYIGSVTYSTGANSSMNVYSLATPTAPVLLRELKQDYPLVNTVHDMHVRNDTIFASCGDQRLYVFAYLPGPNTFTMLGSYSTYQGAGYNHSSSWTANRKHLVFTDEVPASLPIKLVNVENMQNIQPVAIFNPHPQTTPHNPYVLGNDFAFVTSYQDGLNLYNISTPANPFLAGYFDTHPQGGFNVGDYGGQNYRGNWGAYPYLPSGKIIATDMQNGVFILDPGAAYIFSGVEERNAAQANFFFYPNPASDKAALIYQVHQPVKLQMKNLLGQIIFEKNYPSGINDYLEVDNFASGTYLLSVTENEKTITKKIIIHH
jgi:choice-of-anchor B domain-containing protein